MNRLKGEPRPFGAEYHVLEGRSFHMESDLADRLNLTCLPVRKRRRTGRALSLVGAVAAVLAIYQLFFRYEYLTSAGTVFRIDRITHEVCRVGGGGIDCAPSAFAAGGAGPSTSTSTSVSTSTSSH